MKYLLLLIISYPLYCSSQAVDMRFDTIPAISFELLEKSKKKLFSKYGNLTFFYWLHVINDRLKADTINENGLDMFWAYTTRGYFNSWNYNYVKFIDSINYQAFIGSKPFISAQLKNTSKDSLFKEEDTTHTYIYYFLLKSPNLIETRLRGVDCEHHTFIVWDKTRVRYVLLSTGVNKPLIGIKMCELLNNKSIMHDYRNFLKLSGFEKALIEYDKSKK